MGWGDCLLGLMLGIEEAGTDGEGVEGRVRS